MGIIKGCLKAVGTVALSATGLASKILEEASDVVGFELGSELFSTTKNASLNGIQNIWNNETIDNIREKADYVDDLTYGAGRKLMANTAKQAADVARKNSNMEKYEHYKEKYNEFKD